MVQEKYLDRIIFTGRQTDVESIVNIFNIGVLATFTEGISNSILEYMALGKPVIATDGGGTSEIVENGVTGYLVPPSNVNVLLEKLELLLDRPYLAKKMGESGKNVVKRKFEIRKMTKEFVCLYQKLIEG